MTKIDLPCTERRSQPARSRAGTLVAVAVALVAIASPSGGGADEEQSAAPPGEIRFTGENLFATAKGVFHRWRITRVELDPADPASGVVEVEIEVASLDTGNERRDEHLRSGDFFEVEAYPTAHVRVHGARAIEPGEEGRARYSALFDLRVRGAEETLPGEFEVLSVDPPQVRGALTVDRVRLGVGGAPSRFNPMAIEAAVPVEFEARLAR